MEFSGELQPVTDRYGQEGSVTDHQMVHACSGSDNGGSSTTRGERGAVTGFYDRGINEFFDSVLEVGREEVEVGPEVSEEAGMARVGVPEELEIEGVEGGTWVPEGVTEEVAEGTPEVVVEGDEGVAEDERTLEMTDDDVIFVSEGATEVPKGKKRANDAPELMVAMLIQ
ncbi:Hypothetical predicted protein [Olea europaea subsp. europaea]|uniref:Uncharacterized protein n=1 Tax=Olea europaea subsp. europaea TaxID=158383 RepID=A0A8S0UFH4_OLEEU|nr:Hypothetical predicted protein [Olea europaea subsp. europaea]